MVVLPCLAMSCIYRGRVVCGAFVVVEGSFAHSEEEEERGPEEQGESVDLFHAR